MFAKIITVANQKGGAGKTTVSMQIAGLLGKRKFKVLVVDADQQGTAVRWASSAEDENPFPASVIGLSNANAKIHREVKKFINDYDYIFIDCPPAVDSPIPQSAFLISDLVLVPILPSPLDIWATVGIKETILNMKEINETLDSRLILNQCQPRTTLAKEIMDILPNFGIELAKSILRQRQVYRQSAVFGQIVHDFKNKEAIKEVNSLTNEVLEILK